MNTTHPLPLPAMNLSAAPMREKATQERRNRWMARGAGVLASTLAAVPLGFVLVYAWLIIAFAGGATVGGYGAAAESADAAWVPVAAAGAGLVALATDILIGVAVTRGVRHRQAWSARAAAATHAG